MFEDAELGHSLTKAEFEKRQAKLRVDLLAAQRDLAASGLRLVVVIGGVEAAGKSEFANRLLSWIDARGVETHALGEPSDEERERPYFWRFWRLLPGTGRAGFFLTSWYTDALVGRLAKDLGAAQFDDWLDRIVLFEKMLAEEGTVLVKLWFHITKKEQGQRLEALEKDPDTRWRVSKRDWKLHKRYERFLSVCERALAKTSTAEAAWQVVDASDHRYRDATAAGLVLDALRGGLARPPAGANEAKSKPDRPKPKAVNVIRGLDLSRKMPEERFSKLLPGLQNRLGYLVRRLGKKKRSLILAFEGPDAAGKGGAIRRVTGALDARLYQVHPVAAPSDEERAHPFLWRFWRALPRTGRVSIYDRSWYGRVLVERIEGFAAPQQWRRAYAEINEFEEQLGDFGTVILKFWLAISPQEQLRRFEAREETPYKQYKLTREDWRNREKWDAYEAAACEMIERTSTELAPWVLVEAEDKRWARVKVLETIVSRLEKELE